MTFSGDDMIRNQWYAILESNEVRCGKPVGVTRMGEKLVAWRDSGGKVTVMHDLCPHRGVALSAGEVHGDCIWCPFHGFEYDASGRRTVMDGPWIQWQDPDRFFVRTGMRLEDR
jgi:phenylpropionate dioxygenase-like ring-hydroxylating dioxygenase large terminal subunit